MEIGEVDDSSALWITLRCGGDSDVYETSTTMNKTLVLIWRNLQLDGNDAQLKL